MTDTDDRTVSVQNMFTALYILHGAFTHTLGRDSMGWAALVTQYESERIH